MAPYFQRHRPAITPRVEFTPTQQHPLPSITARIEFTAERLEYSNREGEWRDNDEQAGTTRRLTSNKIPKPPGEPGRPGSGGFCVETELIRGQGWSKQAVKDLTEAVRREARKKLDMTMSIRSQDNNAVLQICEKMMGDEGWPNLKKFDNCWPVRSILKLTLKYGAEASRRVNVQTTNRRLRAALRGASPHIPE